MRGRLLGSDPRSTINLYGVCNGFNGPWTESDSINCVIVFLRSLNAVSKYAMTALKLQEEERKSKIRVSQQKVEEGNSAIF